MSLDILILIPWRILTSWLDNIGSNDLKLSDGLNGQLTCLMCPQSEHSLPPLEYHLSRVVVAQRQNVTYILPLPSVRSSQRLLLIVIALPHFRKNIPCILSQVSVPRHLLTATFQIPMILTPTIRASLLNRGSVKHPSPNSLAKLLIVL